MKLGLFEFTTLMSFLDILHLALGNLRQAKLRATLTTMGVIVGVSVIVTMVSFGLGFQSNMLERFKALDLFNEVQVFGRGLSSLVGARQGPRDEGERRTNRRGDREATRILDDAGIKEIAAIPGVMYVEPSVAFGAFVRTNEKVLTQTIGGTNVPNASSRFQHFAAGRMISSPSAEEAVVSERFIRDFGFEKPADAVGKTLELLAPPNENKDEEEETPNFFGIPLDDPGLDESSVVETRRFTIVGVLGDLKEGAGQGGLRGMMPGARVYVPLEVAHKWTLTHRGPMSQVALALAREQGNLAEGQNEGYDAA